MIVYNDAKSYLEKKSQQNKENFGNLGTTFPRISVSEAGEFEIIDGDERQVIGKEFKGVIVTQCYWYAYYDGSSYPYMSNHVPDMKGMFQLIGKGGEGQQDTIIYEGNFAGFKEACFRVLPDAAASLKYKNKISSIKRNIQAYVLYGDKTYRMRVSNTAYGDLKAPEEGTFLYLQKDTGYETQKYIVDFSLRKDINDKSGKSWFTVIMNKGEKITDESYLNQIASEAYAMDKFLFSEQVEIANRVKQNTLDTFADLENILEAPKNDTNPS